MSAPTRLPTRQFLRRASQQFSQRVSQQFSRQCIQRTLRVYALVIKEFLVLVQDPKGRFVLIIPPLVQLLVFSLATTLDVSNVSLVIYNQDRGSHSTELIQRFVASPIFSKITFVDSVAAIHPYIDEQHALAAVHIPQTFSKDVEGNVPSAIQVILDGRKSNAAQILNGYISQIVLGYEQELRAQRGLLAMPVMLVTRNWFNMNLLYVWSTVPSLVAVLALLITLVITSLSVARERELGTFDQLLVSPLMPHEILLGKTIPAVLFGVGEGIVIWAMGVLIFGIPFTGSFLLLLFSLSIFVISIVGVGLFISAISKTQQQAILGAFIFMVPAISLSGYATPIENMPTWLQACTWMNPLKHMLISVKGLFLKDMPFADVWANTWPLLVIAFVSLSIAGFFFRRRME